MRSTPSPISLTTLLGLTLFSTLSAVAASTNTTLSVTAAGSPVTSITSGTVVTLTATVLAGSTPVTPGLVNFCDATLAYCSDVHLVGTAQLTSTGTAILRFVPSVGSHVYKAVFVGTTTNAASTSGTSSLAVSQAGKVQSSTAITQSGTAATGYTLTATTGGNGADAPSGTISFKDASDSNAPLGTASLAAGSPGINLLYKSYLLDGNLPYPLESGVVGDFNEDGFPDIGWAGAGGNLTIALGHGDGTFTGEPNPFYVFNEENVVAADLNSDGHTDLVVPLQSSQQLVILLGNGDGTFTSSTLHTSSPYVQAIHVGDFNGDGIPDLLVAEGYGEDIQVYFGKGDGKFTESVSVAHSYVTYLTPGIGDFNGDGKTDVALVNETEGVSVMLSNGDGHFTSAAAPPTVGHTTYVTAGDFNQDGKLDLLVQNGAGDLYVLPGNGDGTFSAALASSSGFGTATAAQIGDFNGDGIADVFFTNQINSDGTGGVLTVLPGTGDGTFGPAANSPEITDSPQYTLLGDFNDDGKTDVIENVGNLFLAASQTATATISGVNFTPGTGDHNVTASFPGNSSYRSSVSVPTALSTLSAVSISPGNLTFPNTYVGNTAGYQRVTVTNIGDTVLKIQSIVEDDFTSNPNDHNFGIRGQGCGSTLAAGSACTFDVAFRPTNEGEDGGQVILTDDAVDSPQKFRLTGTGLAPIPVLYPQSLTFPATPVGSTAAYQTIVLANEGNIPLTIRAIEITNTTDFYSWGIREQTCGATLAPNAQCSLRIAFRPTRSGTITADLTVDDTVNTWQLRVPMSGTGK